MRIVESNERPQPTLLHEKPSKLREIGGVLFLSGVITKAALISLHMTRQNRGGGNDNNNNAEEKTRKNVRKAMEREKTDAAGKAREHDKKEARRDKGIIRKKFGKGK